MMYRRWLFFISAAISTLSLAGCAYTTKSSLDPAYRTICIQGFYDESREYGLQAPLTNALIRKFLNDGRLRVTRCEDADLMLEGVIRNYQLKGLTYDEKDRVTQYLVVLTAGVRLTDRRTGTVLWEEPEFNGMSTYYARAAGQSSDAIRGNAEVFLTPVRSFASEAENRAAGAAVESLASEIFYRTVEPW
jgi:hypothetical protein